MFLFSIKSCATVGVRPGIISDTQSLKVTRDNIGIKTRGSESAVSIRYDLGCDSHGVGDPSASKGDANGFYNDSGLMCTFRMRTVDAM